MLGTSFQSSKKKGWVSSGLVRKFGQSVPGKRSRAWLRPRKGQRKVYQTWLVMVIIQVSMGPANQPQNVHVFGTFDFVHEQDKKWPQQSAKRHHKPGFDYGQCRREDGATDDDPNVAICDKPVEFISPWKRSVMSLTGMLEATHPTWDLLSCQRHRHSWHFVDPGNHNLQVSESSTRLASISLEKKKSGKRIRGHVGVHTRSLIKKVYQDQKH